jgi:hypothetical protein
LINTPTESEIASRVEHQTKYGIESNSRKPVPGKGGSHGWPAIIRYGEYIRTQTGVTIPDALRANDIVCPLPVLQRTPRQRIATAIHHVKSRKTISA